MRIPDELVEVGLEGGGWRWRSKGEQDRMRKALEAVLPKVRERLLSASAREAGFRAAGQRVPWQGKPTPEALGQALKLGQEAAFDHAFPEEEDLSPATSEPLPIPSKDENAA